MKKVKVVNRENKARVMEFLQREGQLLLPFLDWVETRRMALDELIDVTGRAMIEMLLRLSAEGLAGPKARGRPGGAIRWHGSQGGGVHLSERKHVLGLREGAMENAEVVRALLADLVERGVCPDRRRLFVIDGAKALPKGIAEVFGKANPVQRCRKHKLDNVRGHLPEEEQERTAWVMRAAFKLDAREGMKKLEQHAAWLERSHPSAASSLREGLAELFTINRLNLSPSLRRCLGTTNIIENPNSGMRQRTRNVKRWRDGAMVMRWMAAACLDTSCPLESE